MAKKKKGAGVDSQPKRVYKRAESILIVGDRVSFSPDEGYENPTGKVVVGGVVLHRNVDKTYDIRLSNGKIKSGVTVGKGCGFITVVK